MLSKRFSELRHRVCYTCGGLSKRQSYGGAAARVLVQTNDQFQLNPLYGVVRYSSTNSIVPPLITKAIEASSNVVDSVPNQTSLDTLISSIGPIPEPPVPPAPKVLEYLANGEPSLESMGLAGWSPAGLIQRMLEFVHVNADLSWAATIILVAAVARTLLFYVLVRQRQESAKFSSVMPQIQYLQQKITAAREQNDLIQASRYGMELAEFQKQGTSMFGMLKFAVVQGFVLISFTQALRQMCNLPVESLHTGGYWTFVDLTLKDPTFTLPLANAGLLYLHMATGKEIHKMFPTRPYLVQGIMGTMSFAVFVIGYNFPSAIVLYWISSLSITAIQHRILNHPPVKKYFNLGNLGNPKIAELIEADKKKKKSKLGFWAQMKESRANNRIAEEVRQRADIDNATFERAGREPIRKTYKYDITKVKK